MSQCAGSPASLTLPYFSSTYLYRTALLSCQVVGCKKGKMDWLCRNYTRLREVAQMASYEERERERECAAHTPCQRLSNVPCGNKHDLKRFSLANTAGVSHAHFSSPLATKSANREHAITRPAQLPRLSTFPLLRITVCHCVCSQRFSAC